MINATTITSALVKLKLMPEDESATTPFSPPALARASSLTPGLYPSFPS